MQVQQISPGFDLQGFTTVPPPRWGPIWSMTSGFSLTLFFFSAGLKFCLGRPRVPKTSPPRINEWDMVRVKVSQVSFRVKAES